MSKRKSYEDRLREKLEALEHEVDKLKTDISDMEAQLLPERHDRLEKLHALMDETKEKFHELIYASDEVFEELKEGMEHYWESLGRELKAYQGDSDKS